MLNSALDCSINPYGYIGRIVIIKRSAVKAECMDGLPEISIEQGSIHALKKARIRGSACVEVVASKVVDADVAGVIKVESRD